MKQFVDDSLKSHTPGHAPTIQTRLQIAIRDQVARALSGSADESTSGFISFTPRWSEWCYRKPLVGDLLLKSLVASSNGYPGVPVAGATLSAMGR